MRKLNRRISLPRVQTFLDFIGYVPACLKHKQLRTLMGDFNKQVHGKDDRYPYDKIVVSPIEKDKRQKEDPSSFQQEKNAPSLLALVFSYLQKVLSPILSKADALPSSAALGDILGKLSSLRKLLSTLANEDCSYQPHFNYQLAELWHILKDDCNRLPIQDPSSLVVFDKIKFLISQIENFPMGSDYALGYYLSKNIGQEWNPFPCMQLLKELHDEFVQSPSHSTLHNWILLIDELLLFPRKEL